MPENIDNHPDFLVGYYVTIPASHIHADAREMLRDIELLVWLGGNATGIGHIPQLLELSMKNSRSVLDDGIFEIV